MGKQLSKYALWSRDPKFENYVLNPIGVPNPEMSNWCEENITGIFGFIRLSTSYRIWYAVFENSEDAMAFKLRFG